MRGANGGRLRVARKERQGQNRLPGFILYDHHQGRIVIPACQALYQIVKVEAGPETIDREPTCRACGGPLAGRDGKFVLKYFLLRKAARTWRRP